MRELVFIQACPDDFYYLWQTHAWLESLKKLGKSDKAISCIFTPNHKTENPQWKSLEKLYPEAKFFFYKDTDKITNLLGVYIPILRPYILMKYWKANKEAFAHLRGMIDGAFVTGLVGYYFVKSKGDNLKN